MRTEPENIPEDCRNSGWLWAVFRVGDEHSEFIEGDLPEEIARDMVADYAAEGVKCEMRRQSDVTGTESA